MEDNIKIYTYFKTLYCKPQTGSVNNIKKKKKKRQEDNGELKQLRTGIWGQEEGSVGKNTSTASVLTELNPWNSHKKPDVVCFYKTSTPTVTWEVETELP